MTRLAILDSETLLGQEIKQSLGRRPELWSEVRLLSRSPEDSGAVTEGPDGAALVRELNEESLAGIDVVISCAPEEEGEETRFPDHLSVIQAASSPPLPVGVPIVVGVNSSQIEAPARLVSAHPAVVALARFIAPLREYGISEISCWALLPASIHGQQGLDELLDQTRSILSFSGEQPHSIFKSQLAFNVLPASIPSEDLASQLSRVFDGDLRPTLQVLQGGIFHGVLAGVTARLAQDTDNQALREKLTSSEGIDEFEDPLTVSPVAVAGGRAALLGEVTVSEDGVASLWGVIDNLTTGGADNVLGMLETLIGRRD